MSVARCPLMLLDTLTAPAAPAGRVRIVDADDAALAGVRAAIHVGFGAPGTASGPQSVAERDAAVAGASTSLDTTREAIRAGRSVQVGAFDDTDGPVGGGSHNPRGDVSEIVGVGVLPAYRRRGLAAAVTALLARDAAERGVRTVFCSAESEDVARIYQGVGFRRVGTACIAEMD